MNHLSELKSILRPRLESNPRRMKSTISHRAHNPIETIWFSGLFGGNEFLVSVQSTGDTLADAGTAGRTWITIRARNREEAATISRNYFREIRSASPARWAANYRQSLQQWERRASKSSAREVRVFEAPVLQAPAIARE